jgi:NitT/TauT family transport system permease protein
MTDTNVEATIPHQGAVREEIMEEPSKKLNAKWVLLFQRLAVGIAILGVWELVSGPLIDPFWISEPSQIFQVFLKWFGSGQVFNHIFITLAETVIGFIVGAFVGGAVGLMLGRMKKTADILEPFIMAFYSLPKVALAPLFILWFGIGIEMKIILTAAVVFLLIFFNTFTGVRNVDRELIDVIKLMGATERHVFMKVILPSALTWIFVGLKLSVPYALIGAIVGEITASNRGIGFLIQYSAGQFDTAGVFAALVILMVIANLLNGIIKFFENKFMRWKDTNQSWED